MTSSIALSPVRFLIIIHRLDFFSTCSMQDCNTDWYILVSGYFVVALVNSVREGLTGTQNINRI